MNEPDVRRMAGWIGVDLSLSRVRTPGKPGYGLYRVRTAAELHWHVPHSPITPPGEWTAYAFTLAAIEVNVRRALSRSAPIGPGPLDLMEDISMPAVDGRWRRWIVQTRWVHSREWVLDRMRQDRL